MRSARAGGVNGIGVKKKKRDAPRPEDRDLEARRLETGGLADLTGWNPKTKRANAYAKPTHNPRTTKLYSVSFPVCMV